MADNSARATTLLSNEQLGPVLVQSEVEQLVVDC